MTTASAPTSWPIVLIASQFTVSSNENKLCHGSGSRKWQQVESQFVPSYSAFRKRNRFGVSHVRGRQNARSPSSAVLTLGRPLAHDFWPSIGPMQHEWRWKKWSHTARRIQIAPRQRVVRHCRSARGFGSRCLALPLKMESLELASRWKEHFAPSTHNTWLDYVSPSEFSSRGLTS